MSHRGLQDRQETLGLIDIVTDYTKLLSEKKQEMNELIEAPVLEVPDNIHTVLKNKTPMILLTDSRGEAEFMKYGGEYRTSQSLRLGKDINFIGVHTHKHQQLLRDAGLIQ